MTHPPVCDYDGSDYQSSFWDEGGREYEDRVEAIALKRLLPRKGRLLLEVGAGAGRNTLRYGGFERIVLLDYSRTQLKQAMARIGESERYVYVAADVYNLPFIAGLFDAATMIRTLHHMADAPKALGQVREALAANAAFILEFANKRNVKSIFRYWFGLQSWNPFTPEPVEFARLNFDFHPMTVRNWLESMGFHLEKILTVSHFRIGFLKRTLPVFALVYLDSLLQWTGALWQLTPSVFVKAKVTQTKSQPSEVPDNPVAFFKCPACGSNQLTDHKTHLKCPSCKRTWGIKDGIYDFRKPLNQSKLRSSSATRNLG